MLGDLHAGSDDCGAEFAVLYDSNYPLPAVDCDGGTSFNLKDGRVVYYDISFPGR